MAKRTNSNTDAGSKTSKEIERHVDKIISGVNKEFYPKGDQRIVQMLDAAPIRSDLGVISSGSLLIDDALGIGGFPMGRIVEIYGQEGSGKTTIGLHAVAEAQIKNELEGNGKLVLFVDAEHALDPEYAEAIGVDSSKLILVQPDYAEQAFGIIENFVTEDIINMFVVDSVAALVPKAEHDGSMEDQHVGRQARVMSQSLRKISGAMNRHNVLGIFINQLREKIGVMFGNPETTPGGRALKFWSTIRLAARQKRGDSGNITEQAVMSVDVVKNKVAPPHKKVEVDIIFGQGIDIAGEVVKLAISREIITKSGSWYSYGDESLGQGIDGVKSFFEENPDIYNTIQRQIEAEIRPHKFVGITPDNDESKEVVDNKADAPIEKPVDKPASKKSAVE